MAHVISKAECDEMQDNYKKHSEAGTLKRTMKAYYFSPSQCKKLDVSKGLTVIPVATKKGVEKTAITDGSIILEKPIDP